MSLLAVQGGATGTGTVTLLAPITNTNRTLTLPDATGTVLTNATTTGFPAGSVLQVVNATLAGLVTTTSSTPSDTGLSATITPTSSSSKILCLVDIGGCEKGGGSGGGPYMRFTLMRASTDLIRFEGQGGYTANTSTNSFGACSTNYLDSPSTTSATTYKVQFSNTANAGTVGFNNSSSVATMTLMEIAA